jgi:uncharacterized protein (TIRG00374 family)
VGVALSWLAFSQIDFNEATNAIKSVRHAELLFALGLYWSAVLVRIVRWRVLLNEHALISMRKVGMALVVGYAVNNILPARLGEIFRVHYLRKRFGFSGSAALGTILVERFFDGVIALSLLLAGLLNARSTADDALKAAFVVALVIGVLTGLVFVGVVLIARRYVAADGGRIQGYAKRFAHSFSVFARKEGVVVLLLSGVAWALEVAAVRSVLLGFAIDTTFGGLLLVAGAAAVSTLLPSAPGYAGSLQLAFIVSYSTLGIGASLAVTSATAIQVLLFGSLTLAGLVIWLADYFWNAPPGHVNGAPRKVQGDG